MDNLLAGEDNLDVWPLEGRNTEQHLGVEC